MTTFLSRLRLFRTFASLGLPLLTWLLLLPMAASSQSRHTADEPGTMEIRNPREHNPLAPSEIDRGKLLAESSDQIKRAKASVVGFATSSAAGLPRSPVSARLAATVQSLKPLYVQSHDDKNDHPDSRKADVMYYNYSTNETIRVVVDLKSNTVQETRVASGVTNQPFFTRAEVEAALQLILDDAHTGPLLQKAYQKITGLSLVDVINQLKDAQGGIFFHDTHTPWGMVTADCVHDRCMQLFIPIDEASYIDMSNVVVDLSKMQVLWIDAGPTPHIH